MVKTFANEVHDAIKKSGYYSRFTESPRENERILNDMLSKDLNITKSDLRETDLSFPGTSRYLIFLLQQGGIDFELCPFYKMWYSAHGVQERCRFNIGPVHAGCKARRPYCEHPEEYSMHIVDVKKK
ncbi:MAG: hypothetical protein AABX14_04805 [Candidatus Aenigmatarchaeota archaeon]